MTNPENNFANKGAIEASKILTTQFYSFTENRQTAEHRIRSLQNRGMDEEVNSLESLIASYDMFDTCFRSNTKRQLKKFPIWNYFLSKVEDLDNIAALSLIVGIEDIAGFDSATKLWSFCGMNPYKVDVKTRKRWFPTEEHATDYVNSLLRNRRMRISNPSKSHEDELRELLGLCVWGDGYITKKLPAKDDDGRLENWNKFLKKVCVLIGKDFDKGTQNGFYHKELRNYERIEIHSMSLADSTLRENLESQLPKGMLAKANAKAQKETVKLFLTHLYQYWRMMRGLPIKKPRLKIAGSLITFPGMSELKFSDF